MFLCKACDLIHSQSVSLGGPEPVGHMQVCHASFSI